MPQHCTHCWRRARRDNGHVFAIAAAKEFMNTIYLTRSFRVEILSFTFLFWPEDLLPDILITSLCLFIRWIMSVDVLSYRISIQQDISKPSLILCVLWLSQHDAVPDLSVQGVLFTRSHIGWSLPLFFRTLQHRFITDLSLAKILQVKCTFV